MKDLISVINSRMSNIHDELLKFENGNKAAGQRARKATLELERLFKEFRKRSINETPKKD